jgi:hypothetical protein
MAVSAPGDTNNATVGLKTPFVFVRRYRLVAIA